MPSSRFEVSLAAPADARADLLVLPCFAATAGTGAVPVPGGPGVAEVSRALGTGLAEVLHGGQFAGREFRGRLGETFETLSLGRVAAARVMLVGLGPEAKAGPGAIREAAMMAARQMGSAASIATTVPAAAVAVATAAGGSEDGTWKAAASAFAEGLLLGGYRFDRYKRYPPDESPRPALTTVSVLAGPARLASAQAGLRRGELLGRVTNWARDLVTTPAADATPADLTDEARRLAAACGLSCSVLAAAELARGGFGGILGVGQGSANEPRLVELSYRGGGDSPVFGLTGKGITFDSGGLSLKRTSEIEWMKSDMAGAAAIMAAMQAAAELNLAVNLDAVLPFAENMPGGSALRPGDVITHRGGRTSEVLDTDCEGRLVIADALAYLAEREPAALIDVATLTDAAGLGDSLFAVLGNDQALVDKILAAGADAGDPGWQLPMPTAYRRYLESPVADIRNTPRAVPDSTVLAGLYLSEFVGTVPWAHIDNGSTAYLEQATDCWPEGATGSPARAILHWIERSTEMRTSSPSGHAHTPQAEVVS
jgi:leucyl aminopeptidase